MSSYVIAGLVGVSNMILWGIYGDLLVERFRAVKVLRSLALALVGSAYLFLIEPDLPLIIVALSVVALERMTTEIYKACIRVEDQSKYKIPSDLGIVAINRPAKKVVGLAIIATAATMGWCLAEVRIESRVVIVMVALVVAGSGALKDAPYEGFSALKFVRSPILAVAAGLLLVAAFPDLPSLFLALSVAGGERILSEFYKKILRGSVPGKFRAAQIDRNWQDRRRYVLILYGLNIAALLALFLTERQALAA
jgi:hypothetical protein